MGAEFTAPVAPKENQILIDWFAWTLKVDDPREAILLSGLDSMDFQKSSGGGMGYKSTLRSGNVVVYYDGNDGMGCHVSLTGQGCRQYEAYKGTKHCWYQLMVQLMKVKANFTRLDLAIDNVDGALRLDRLLEAIETKSVRSKFKKGQRINGFSLGDESEVADGETIYLGSKASRFKIRFYDKAAQMNIPNQHWVRCELQCMAERAIEAVKHLLRGVDVGHLAFSIINNYFTPINKDDSNISRCSTQAWWSAWLATTDILKLSTSKMLKLVDESMEHLKRQYSATIAMCRKYLGVARFRSFMDDLLETGKEKLTKKHALIIKTSRLAYASSLPF
nr:replication initiation factor domain-containing protein [Pelotalea chapellei]